MELHGLSACQVLREGLYFRSGLAHVANLQELFAACFPKSSAEASADANDVVWLVRCYSTRETSSLDPAVLLSGECHWAAGGKLDGEHGLTYDVPSSLKGYTSSPA